MIDNLFERLYFEWLSTLAFPNKEERSEYSNLLYLLYTTPFYFNANKQPLDENRYKDGIYLRGLFIQKMNIPRDSVSNTNNTLFSEYYACNLLEMICALANRISNDIMADYGKVDRTDYWVHLMLSNLGVLDFTNHNWQPNEVIGRLVNFMDRTYERNGRGGLFTLKDNRFDTTKMSIWDIMSRYITENYYNKEEKNYVY